MGPWPRQFVPARAGRSSDASYLRSLIASAEERVDLHRERGHRLRHRVATRRLRKLLAYENQRHARIGAAETAPPRLALAVVTVSWVASMVLLGVLKLEAAGALWLTILEVPTLALVVLWFWLAVACVPAVELHSIRGRHPAIEGS